MKLYQMTARQLRKLLDAGDVTAVDVAEALLERIDATEKRVAAYLTLRPEAVMEEAKEADRRLREGEEVGPFTGIPVSLKDNINTKGVRTTCASKMLAEFVPPYDATVAARLKGMGAPLAGKLNMDEFAMGSGTETSAFFPTRNPWDLTRVPGGSSGGSAAAVAADSAIIALGSDTGGSIRQPAAFCGVVGVKPTYGRVSRFGVVPLASSLDVVGPIAKDVRDAAMMLEVISGNDPLDATSMPGEVPRFAADLKDGVQGVVVGMPREFFGAGVAPEVKEAVTQAIRLLESLGAEVVEVSLPHTAYAVDVYRILVAAEASSVMAKYDGVRFGYRSKEASDVVSMFTSTRGEALGTEVKRRILRGTYALSAEHYQEAVVRAQKVRTLIRQDFEAAFKECTVLAAPAAPTGAYPLGAGGDDPAAAEAADMLVVPANLAGIPALSLPCGKDSEGLPIGLQLMGPMFSESTLFNVAYAYEQAAGLVPFKPALEVELS